MKSMNIRKKLVSLAVASAVSGGAMLAMSVPAHAVNVSQNEVGQVLLFPYYTVKNGLDTIFTVTNTSDKTAVFKIRWREALNSRETRDFNVILSPKDVWTGAVTRTADGNGALIRTFDNTCTSPMLPASGTVSGAREVPMTNALFTGNFTDGATGDITRVQEGYFEVILMGMSDRSHTNSSNTLEYNAKHVNNVPRDCAKVDALFLSANIGTLQGYMTVPENVLKGTGILINVANGTAIDANPTAIEGWRTSGNTVAEPGDLVPDLRNGTPGGNALQIVNGVGQSTGFGSSEDGVSTVLRATSLLNEYATGAGASTSWVVTFPTKHHYTDSYTSFTGPTLANSTPTGGFSEWFFTPVTTAVPTAVKNGKSCDNIGMSIYNREEATVLNVGNTQFSPLPTAEFVELCYEVNVVNFNSSNVFGAGTNRLGVNTTLVGTAGWAELSFTEASATTAGGLPVIGFAASVRDAGGAAVNYGSSAPHAYKRRPE